jgi:hypothetical protein
MYRLRQPLPRQARSITTIALRRENKGRWERRVALTPQGVESLIKETGAKFLVQPSTNRVYNEQQYVEVRISGDPFTPALPLILSNRLALTLQKISPPRILYWASRKCQ